MILSTGQIIASRYEIIEKIGQGGMSIVYKAKDIRLGRSVTFKVLKEEHLTDAEFVQRFKTEASAIARLSHPNIVNVYDVGQEGSINYIVMEYIKGATLKELIEKNAPFSEKEIYGVSVQIAEALAHAHKNGIIHRDIKPQNILVTKNGEIKVMDFGIARTANSDTIAVGGSTMGSVHYFSPEQAKGSIVSYQSDLYSLGIVMFEMATGRLPYDSDQAVSIAIMHINEPFPDLTEFNPDVSSSFKAIVGKLTEKKPQNRYQTAEKVIIDLKRMLINSSDRIVYGTEFLTDSSTIKITGQAHEKIKGAGKNPPAEPDIQPDSGRIDIAGEIENELGYETEKPASKKQELLLIGAALLTSFVIIAVALYFLWPVITKTQTNKNNSQQTVAEVPGLVGKNFDDAEKLAKDLGLELEVLREEFNPAAKGEILEQNYDVGNYVNKGIAIGVVVSKGTEEFTVPSLTDMDINRAYELIGDSLSVNKVYKYSDTTASDIVMEQSVTQGTTVNKGSEITLTISQGPEIIYVEVPTVVGKTEDEAKRMITDAGLTVGTSTTNQSLKYARGIVSAQSILGGKEAPKGSIVSIEVSTGAPPTQSPSPTPQTTIPSRSHEIKIDFPFPENAETVHVLLCKKTATDMVTVVDKIVRKEEVPFSLNVVGEGTVEFVLFIDGVETGSKTVEFPVN